MRAVVNGRRRALGRSRVSSRDFLYFAQGIPACTQSREIDLSKLLSARKAGEARISIAAIFIRALVLVAARWPVLRQCYMRWPWSHVYEVDQPVAMIAVAREFCGEDWLFFGRLKPPEINSLESIERELTDFRSGPVEQRFKVQLNQSALPLIIRRAQIWVARNVYPQRRAKHFGTFGLTTVGSRRSTIDTPPLINSASFSYGPIDENGRCRLTVTYDHRLIDGAPVARLLEDVESTLNGIVCEELANPIDSTRQIPTIPLDN